MRFSKKVMATLITTFAITLALAPTFISQADENVSFGAVTGKIVKPGNGSPKSVTNVVSPEGMNLDAIVTSSGLDALGEGNTPPDPILGLTPLVNYQMRNAGGGIITQTTSNLNTYLYHPQGFNAFYMEHAGIGRYYYRVFTQQRGWLPWASSKETTPTSNDGDKVQAIQIRVKGYTAELDDLYYKVVLNDGTALDWAKNGQTTGTIGTDKYIVAIKVALWHKTNVFPQSTSVLMESPRYEGPYLDASNQVQYSRADDKPYTGWAFYDNEQYYFSEGSRAVGWQYINGLKFYFDQSGKLVKDLEPIMGLTGNYQIRTNKATRTLTVYAKDGNNGYIIPYKTFMTTNGPATPIGTFSIYAKYRWKIMHDNIYCQFLSRFKNGYILHSLIYYDKANSDHLDPNTYNYMDDANSDGCIRLKAGDANWIYSNCPNGTPVIVYEDRWDKGPVERPAIDKPIPTSQHYDPTDPVKASQNAADQAARDAIDAPRVAAVREAQAQEAAKRAAELQAESGGTATSSNTETTDSNAPSDSAPVDTSSPSDGQTQAPDSAAPSETSANESTTAP